MTDGTRTEVERHEREVRQYAALCRALGEFLGGENQVRMSIALSLPRGQMKAVAEIWRDARQSVPGIFGYPTAAEAELAVREFLFRVHAP